MAVRQNLVAPQAGQVIHLDGNRPDGAFALAK
jgi:hypothetical protein